LPQISLNIKFSIYKHFNYVFQNNEGGEKVRNEFQSQVKKLASESTLVPSKDIEVDTQVSEEIINEVEEISVDSTNIEEVPVAISDSIDIAIGGLTISTEDTTLDVNESEIETVPTNILPSSTTPPEVQIQNADVANTVEDPILSKKTTDEESVKSGNKFMFVWSSKNCSKLSGKVEKNHKNLGSIIHTRVHTHLFSFALQAWEVVLLYYIIWLSTSFNQSIIFILTTIQSCLLLLCLPYLGIQCHIGATTLLN